MSRRNGHGTDGPLAAFLAPSAGPDGRRSARDWVVDSLAFLLAVIAGALGLLLPEVVSAPLLPVPPLWLNLVVGIVGCGALWLRRRRPVGLAVISIVLSVGLTSLAGVSLVALFTVAVHRRFGIAAWVTVLGIASSFGQYALYPSDPDTAANYWASVGFGVALAIAAAAWGVVLRTRRQLVRSLAERAERAEAEQQLRVEQGRRRERERIAREMHDALGHRLSLLNLHAGALEYRADMPQEDLAKVAGVIRASAHQCLVDLREILVVLRSVDQPDGEQRPAPSLTDVPELVAESRAAGMELRVSGEVVDGESIPVAVGRHGYRIVQEGLTNARKHAPAERVELILSGAPGDGLTVEIRNGLPATPPEVVSSGLGLAGLAERAVLAGGQLEYGRTLSSEFRLWARLPWPA